MADNFSNETSGDKPCSSAMPVVQPSTLSPQPPLIPDHELLKRIGAGSYGEVWLARSVVGTLRAVKIVWRKTFWSDHPFEREFKGIQKAEPISREHEGLVDILHIGRGDGYFFYVMELADGEEMQNEECKMGNEAAANPISSTRQQSILNYRPKTLDSLLRINSQLSTLNPQPTTARLPVAECVQVGLTLTSALAHLHKHKLVHRDVKPGNVIFVAGVPKLADIGLVAETSESKSYVGTEGFIPPEGPGTPQADLYSLGKLLYEISTGKDRHAFPELPSDLAEQSETEQLVELNAILLKACQPNPRERYQSADEMHADLTLLQRGQSVKARHTTRQRLSLARNLSIATAILALVATGGWLFSNRFDISTRQRPSVPTDANSIALVHFDKDRTRFQSWYLNQSLAGGISTVLTNVAELRVAPLPGLQAFHNDTNDAPEIGRQLGVQWVLKTVLYKEPLTQSNAIQVVAKLIHLPDATVAWSTNYDRMLDDLGAIQRDVLDNLSRALGVSIPTQASERMETNVLRKVEAYKLARRGSDQMNLKTREGFTGGVRVLNQAMDIDPTYPFPHYTLSFGYVSASEYSLPPHQAMPQAKSWALKALQLNDAASPAHNALGLVKLLYEWDLEGAEKAIRRAIELEPNLGSNHGAYAVLLRALGRLPEARAEQELSIQLYPSNLSYAMRLAEQAIAERNYDEALKRSQELLAKHPDFILAHYSLGLAYEKKRLYDQALAEYQQFRAMEDGPNVLAMIGHLYALRGEREEALGVLNELEAMGKSRYVSPVYKARIHLRLGDRMKALDLLEQAREERCGSLIWLKTDDDWDSLRDEPRFKAILKEVGLENVRLNVPTEVNSIAVVPFGTGRKPGRSSYLTDSLAGGICTALTNATGLRTIPLADVFVFRGNTNDAPEIGRELGARWVLQTVFRKYPSFWNQEIQVAAKLIHLPDETLAWSMDYDRKLDDLVAIQRDVLANVTRALSASIPTKELDFMGTNLLRKVEAWQLALQGTYRNGDGTRAGFTEGVQKLHRAVAIDPTYLYPNCMLAWAYANASEWHLPPHQTMTEARSWALKALQLNDTDALAHCMLGRVKMDYDWDLEGAEKALRRAIELDTDSAPSHGHFAQLLRLSGRLPEARVEQELAIRLNASNRNYALNLASQAIVEKNYDSALKVTQELLAENPDYYLAHRVQGRIYEKKGLYDQALTEYRQVQAVEDGPEILAMIGHLHALRGEREEALRLLGELETLGKSRFVSPVYKARIQLRLGDRLKALDLLKQAREERCGSLTMLKIDDDWDSLRDEPRFKALLKQVGLEK